MRFLIDEDLPRATGDLLRQYRHEAVDVRDAGLRGSKDSPVRRICCVSGARMPSGILAFLFCVLRGGALFGPRLVPGTMLLSV